MAPAHPLSSKLWHMEKSLARFQHHKIVLTIICVETGSISSRATSVGHLHVGRRTASGGDELQPYQNAPQSVLQLSHYKCTLFSVRICCVVI